MRRIAGVVLALGWIVLPLARASAQEGASVEIHDNYFSPAEIHVVEGTTVTWTDLGGAHSVTADDGSFDSSPACIAGLNCMANGDTFAHTFRLAGTITYHCRVHGSAMVGRVVVDPVSTTTSSTSTTTSTTAANTTTTSSDASAPPASGQPTTITQFPLPNLPSSSRAVALPRPISRTSTSDDVRPWALLAVAIAATTTIAGVILVRRGRVPFG